MLKTKIENSSRHIVFVGGTSEPGGLHIHTAEAAQACAALGQSVTILCPSINYFKRLLSDSRVTVECVPSFEAGTRNERERRWLGVASRYRNCDIVLCRGRFAETEIADLAILAGFANRIFSIEHRPWEGPWSRPLSKNKYGRHSGLLLHRSIAVSEEIRASAVNEFGFPAPKLRTCLNWVHPDFHLPTEQERFDARAALGIPPSMLHIGYMGRLAPEKRVDILLRAFALVLPDIKQPVELGITGDGWKRPELGELAGKLGIIDHVRFFGWSASPSTMLRACDIFVLPSLVEGFPLALMEAMASGCACLAHPMSSTTELFYGGNSGLLVDMNSVDGLAAGLFELSARGSDARIKMGKVAAARIAKDFSRERRLPDLLSALDISTRVLPEAGSRLLDYNQAGLLSTG